nr:hydrogenase expression/formation protein HypE [Hyperthermus butylicus]
MARGKSWRVLWKFITLAHGSGGRETGEIVEKLIRPMVPEELWRVEGGWGLDVLDDSALIPLPDGRYLAFTVDSYTVKPLFFPGGDLGKLAASGVINDLLMAGAKPLAAVDAVVVEEGFPVEDLARILESLASTLAANKVALIGGDFKVVPKGDLDGVIITMAGVGVAEKPIVDTRIRDGDKIVVSGYLGDHGAAILSVREGIGLKLEVESDVKPLTDLMIPLIERYADYIHAAGDPTRGGLAMLLNDWAKKNGLVIAIDEAKIPVREQVRAYAELLGVDPLALASEGAAVLAVDPLMAEEVVEFMRSLGYEEATIIGEVRVPRQERHRGLVIAKTMAGGFRIVEPPSGELVPRIC